MAGKVISFFSHKGGVGKTTLTYNIGAELAVHRGKKVLLIDADGQMNLTANMFGLSDKVEYNQERNKQWQDWTEKYMSFNDLIRGVSNKSIYGYRDRVEFSNVPDKEKDFTFDLLIADKNYFELDMSFYEKIEAKYSRSDNREYFSKIVNKLTDLSERYDFILVDCSPSASSALNAFCVLISDYVISPVKCDFFSYQAVGGLNDIMNKWKNLFSSFQSTYNSRCIDMKHKFLGLIVNGTKKRNKSKGGISNASNMWMEAVNECLAKFIVNSNNCISKAEFMHYFHNAQPYVITHNTVEYPPALKSSVEKIGIPLVLLEKRICDMLGSKADSILNIKKYKENFDKYCGAIQYIAKCFENLK